MQPYPAKCTVIKEGIYHKLCAMLREVVVTPAAIPLRGDQVLYNL